MHLLWEWVNPQTVAISSSWLPACAIQSKMGKLRPVWAWWSQLQSSSTQSPPPCHPKSPSVWSVSICIFLCSGSNGQSRLVSNRHLGAASLLLPCRHAHSSLMILLSPSLLRLRDYNCPCPTLPMEGEGRDGSLFRKPYLSLSLAFLPSLHLFFPLTSGNIFVCGEMGRNGE